jgi:hypothetical protein
MRRRVSVILGVMGLALLMTVTVSEADWLVMTDGTRVETAGPWEVKGNLVVFSLPNGSLASVRVANIDLGVSAEISMAAKQATAEPEPQATAPEKQKATFVLTDDDLPQYRVNAAASEEEPDTGTPGDGTVKLVVSSPAAGITLSAILYDADGIVLVESEAQLNSRSLAAQRRTNFRFDLPNIFSFAAIEFEVDALGLATPSESRDTSIGEAETAPLETAEIISSSAAIRTPAQPS